MFSLFSKYLVQFLRNGKVVSQEFCNTEEEIKVLRAVAHSKGCECEISCLSGERSVEKKEPEQSPAVEKKEKRIGWNIPCRCVETGKEYASVSECSIETGIKKRSLYNALVSGYPRKGLHFVRIENPHQTLPKKERKKKRVYKCVSYRCITTGEVFDSVSDVFQKYNFSVSSFYRAVSKDKEINGLKFAKVK